MPPYMLGKVLKMVVIGLAKLLQQVTLTLNNLSQQRLCQLCKDQRAWVQSWGSTISTHSSTDTAKEEERDGWGTLVFNFLCLETCHFHSLPRTGHMVPTCHILTPPSSPAHGVLPPWRLAWLPCFLPRRTNNFLHRYVTHSALIRISNLRFSDCLVISLSQNYFVSPIKAKQTYLFLFLALITVPGKL